MTVKVIITDAEVRAKTMQNLFREALREVKETDDPK